MKLIYVLAGLFAASAVQAATQYTLDGAHSSVAFTIDHLTITKVHGRFDKFNADFTFDDETGKVENLTAKIDIDTINTNDTKRDEHLKSDDFFGVRVKNKLNEAKRWMTFKSTKVDVKGKKPTKITGDLTMNGITKPVTLDVTYRGTIKDPWGNQKLGFEAKGKINRKDFGITFNKVLDTGGLMIGETVDIVIAGEAAAAKSTQAVK